MSIKKVCDRCNKIREEGGEDFDHVEYIVAGEHKERSCDNKYPEYDLCPECAKQFRMFINGGTVEEDRYKDSKPCAVVIHKLAGGNYGIENAPDDSEKNEPEKEKTSCTDDRPIMHCFSCKACDPYGHSVPENHGYCLMNCEKVSFDKVACSSYVANE